MFMNRKWRIIDTPGFGDTGLCEERIADELKELFRYAKYGISAVVVVVKKGRFTREQETIVRSILDLFGGELVLPYCMLAVTRSNEPQEKLLDDIGKLPLDHGLRRLGAVLEDRVLPIENIKEPAKMTSRLLMHYGILEIIDQNNGETFKQDAIPAGSGQVAKLSDGAVEPPSAGMRGELEDQGMPSTLPEGTRCTFTFDPAKRQLTTVCTFPPLP